MNETSFAICMVTVTLITALAVALALRRLVPLLLEWLWERRGRR